LVCTACPENACQATSSDAYFKLNLPFHSQTAFFLVLFLGQYAIRKLLYFPYISNPITNFVDLMYLANISGIVLDERHVGSYIHGRNNAQHSDTTLR
jgi:meckelin